MRREIIDLTQKKFGQLTALSPTSQRRDGSVVWKCVCECGATVYAASNYLLRGRTKSCGCLLREGYDIANQRFGQLTALRREGVSKDGRKKWLCRCDCGNLIVASVSNLKTGHTRSCGCLRDREYRTMVDGTCLEVIASGKIYKNNTSGIKGVSYHSRTNSWIATIRFCKRTYYLGKYKTIIEAATARRLAEEKFYGPILEKHRHLLKGKAPEAKEEFIEFNALPTRQKKTAITQNPWRSEKRQKSTGP
jgi:hypothetical protein